MAFSKSYDFEKAIVPLFLKRWWLIGHLPRLEAEEKKFVGNCGANAPQFPSPFFKNKAFEKVNRL